MLIELKSGDAVSVMAHRDNYTDEMLVGVMLCGGGEVRDSWTTRKEDFRFTAATVVRSSYGVHLMDADQLMEVNRVYDAIIGEHRRYA